MTNIQLLLVVWLLLGYPLLWVLARQRAAKVLAATVDRMESESKTTFMRGTQHLAEECASLKVEVERAREVADEARAKTARYLDKISDFERERTTWQTSYFEQSVGHGNAQQLMMNTIETLAKQLQAKGVRPQIPSVIHAVRSEFEANHEMPARAALEAIEAAKAAQAAAQSSPAET